MKIKIAHLYPDMLNLYGDRGNIETLERRLQWRGIDVEVSNLPIGWTEEIEDFDIIFIGGGQDFEQEIILSDLTDEKREAIRAAVEAGKTFLCICGGYQMMGDYYETADGKRFDYIGAADFYTVGGNERLIGNCAFEIEGYNVVGFENHSGRTYLGEKASPLGKVVKGNGNNGKDGYEGIRYKNFFGTYSHGPVLPKNPVFADMVIKSAMEHKYGVNELSPLDDSLENKAHKVAEKIAGI